MLLEELKALRTEVKAIRNDRIKAWTTPITEETIDLGDEKYQSKTMKPTVSSEFFPIRQELLTPRSSLHDSAGDPGICHSPIISVGELDAHEDNFESKMLSLPHLLVLSPEPDLPGSARNCTATL